MANYEGTIMVTDVSVDMLYELVREKLAAGTFSIFYYEGGEEHLKIGQWISKYILENPQSPKIRVDYGLLSGSVLNDLGQLVDLSDLVSMACKELKIEEPSGLCVPFDIYMGPVDEAEEESE